MVGLRPKGLGALGYLKRSALRVLRTHALMVSVVVLCPCLVVSIHLDTNRGVANLAAGYWAPGRPLGSVGGAGAPALLLRGPMARALRARQLPLI